MRVIVVLLALVHTAAAFAQAYRWVDENGVVHYSDRPVPGAERIDIETDKSRRAPASGIAPPASGTAPTGRATASDNRIQSTDELGYQRIDLVRPLQGETLWNIGATLTVSLRVTPALAEGDRIRLIYDGQQINDLPTDQLDLQLPEVYRGQHTIQAEIENAAGDTLIQSSVRTFYVRQTSALN